MGIKNLASNRRDIGIAAKHRTMEGRFRSDQLKRDGDLRQNPTMLCEGITEVRTAIGDHLRHPVGI